MLDEFDSSLFAMRDPGVRRAGQISLACIPTAAFYFLPGVIARFSEQYPNIRFRILDLSANDGLESVARGEVEFGINLLGSSDPELTFEPLLEEPFVLACRRDHAFAQREAVDWADLNGQRVIMVSRASGNRIILDAALAKADVRAVFVCQDERLLGVVTRKTLVREVVAPGRDPRSTRVGEIAEPPHYTFEAESPAEAAFRFMEEKDAERVPVVDGDRLVGVLSRVVLQRRLAEDEPPENPA
jgi:DNA-binding transcriptional LysR family regulator